MFSSRLLRARQISSVTSSTGLMLGESGLQSSASECYACRGTAQLSRAALRLRFTATLARELTSSQTGGGTQRLGLAGQIGCRSERATRALFAPDSR